MLSDIVEFYFDRLAIKAMAFFNMSRFISRRLTSKRSRVIPLFPVSCAPCQERSSLTPFASVPSSNEWYQALHPAGDASERLLALERLNEHLPYFTQHDAPKKIQAADVYLFSSDELETSSLHLLQGTDEFSFSEGAPVGSMKSHVINDIGCPMTDWSLKITDMETDPDRIWMVIRYTVRT